MIKAICLDTRILSTYLKGKESAYELIEKYQTDGYELYTTVVNITEFFMGLYKIGIVSEVKKKRLKNFFLTLHPRSIDYEAGVLAGNLYATTLKGQPIGWRDTFIAAIVLLNGRFIITSNPDHFKRIPDINVIEYY